MSRTRKSLLALLAVAALTPLMRLMLAALLPDVTVDPVPGCIAGMLASVLTLGLPACLLRPWTGGRLTQRRLLWPGVLLGAASAVLVRAALGPVDVRWQALTGLVPSVMPVPDSIPLGALCVTALAVVPALTEEAFFRGALLTGLLEGGRRWTAIVLTTAVFVLLHGSLANLPSLLAVSLALTLLMLHTGHIAVPMAAHLVYNLTAMGWGSVPLWVSAICGAGLIGLFVRIRTAWPETVQPTMRKADGLIAAAAVAVLILSYMI